MEGWKATALCSTIESMERAGAEHWRHSDLVYNRLGMTALKAVNQELVGLFRDIGRIIVEKQAQFGWGENVVDRLARNLHNMRRFYETYDQDPNLKTLSAKLPWSHNLLIIEKCADNQERLINPLLLQPGHQEVPKLVWRNSPVKPATSHSERGSCARSARYTRASNSTRRVSDLAEKADNDLKLRRKGF